MIAWTYGGIRSATFRITIGPSHVLVKAKENARRHIMILFFFLSKGDFFWIFFYVRYIQHCFICSPKDSAMSEDAGIEPRTVATTPLALRHSNHSARSHPHPMILNSPFISEFVCLAISIGYRNLVFIVLHI
jgi:hypothetical protein